MRIHETLLGLLFMALAAAFFAYTFTFPALPGQNVGPSLFPRVTAVGVFVCGIVMAVRGWRSGRALVEIDAALRAPRGIVSFALVPLAVVFYIVAAPRLGFLPVAAIIVAVLAMWMGRTRLGCGGRGRGVGARHPLVLRVGDAHPVAARVVHVAAVRRLSLDGGTTCKR